MEKLLVHICCGVDAVYALRKLKEEFPQTTIEGYFYDPNIHPEEEYYLRWLETERVCNQLGIKCHLGEYELDRWFEAVKGFENEPERGERCTICHDLRLEKTAVFARENGFEGFTTVLMMSPKKDFQVLKTVGENVAERYGLKFVAVDFRKNGGVEKMNRLSKEAQLYHQNYCGCMYALFQQREGDLIGELVSFGKGRLPGSKEELIFIKELRKYAEDMALPCEEKEFNFVNWRLISSTLKINKKDIPHSVVWFSRSIKGVLRARVQEVIKENGMVKLLLNKQNAEIWITNDVKSTMLLRVPRPFINPIFIIEDRFVEGDIASLKFEATLKASFDENGLSRNLVIGRKEAKQTVEFYSDTLPDGTASFSLEDIKESIRRNAEQVRNRNVKVVVYGCETVGRLGRLKGI